MVRFDVEESSRVWLKRYQDLFPERQWRTTKAQSVRPDTWIMDLTKRSQALLHWQECKQRREHGFQVGAQSFNYEVAPSKVRRKSKSTGKPGQSVAVSRSVVVWPDMTLASAAPPSKPWSHRETPSVASSYLGLYFNILYRPPPALVLSMTGLRGHRPRRRPDLRVRAANTAHGALTLYYTQYAGVAT